MPDYSNLAVLIVEPSQNMRASVSNMLTQLAVTKVDHAVSSSTAIQQINMRSYDVILCEYDLGSEDYGQDGQQLLEDLRHNELILPSTIFIMLTSEGVYSKVLSAAELLPSDYILKPFTVDVLSQRLARAIERRAIFLPAHQLMSEGRLREAIAACVEGARARARHALDFTRLRAELHVSLGELETAELAYQSIVAMRPLGWAQLGQARCLFQMRRYEEAQRHLETLLALNPQFMAAYDLLAQTHQVLGRDADAKRVLEDAVAISPHMVRRLRHLGDVAYATGDVAGAEKAYKQVVAKARYSDFRDPEDHLNLVRTLVRKGDASGVGGVIRDLDRSLRSSPNTAVCRAYASALLQELNGDAGAAAGELAAAVAQLADARGLSVRLKLGLAEGCLKHHLDQQGTELLAGLRADPSSGVGPEQVHALCEQAGRADLLPALGDPELLRLRELERETDRLVRRAADKSGRGELRAAVDVIQQALRRRPDHAALWPVALTAMLRQMAELGWEPDLGSQCADLLRRLREHQPDHPLLPGLVSQYAAVRRLPSAIGAPQ